MIHTPRVAIGGQAFTQMVEGEKLFDIVLRLPPALRNNPNAIRRIMVDVPGSGDNPGYRVPLSQLTTITPHKPGASYIYRENNRRFIPIKFSVRGRDLQSAIDEAERKVNDPVNGARLPKEGYSIKWAGEFEQMQEANDRLMWIIPLSLVMIMILLYSMFGSVKDCMLVLVNVLEAAMGGVWALYFTETHFSVSAAVGFVSVFGVAVQDGVLLVTYHNQMRARGYSVWETCMRGTELRIRPVVMTSLTAALGLLPAAVATSIGSQAQKPLAIVVVGAMLCTLFLTRYIMPVLYSYFPNPLYCQGEGEGAVVEGTVLRILFGHCHIDLADQDARTFRNWYRHVARNLSPHRDEFGRELVSPEDQARRAVDDLLQRVDRDPSADRTLRHAARRLKVLVTSSISGDLQPEHLIEFERKFQD